MVDDACSERVESIDFTYEIEQAVSREMQHFDPNDHVDFNDLVNDAVADMIDDVVEARLSDLLEEKLKNANITINF